MKTFKLHLIRHGLTSGNLQGLYIGSGTDIPLCDEGRAQLAELKERFEYPQVDTVFSSPLMRAVETANILFPNASFYSCNSDVIEYYRSNCYTNRGNKAVAGNHVHLRKSPSRPYSRMARWLSGDFDRAQINRKTADAGCFPLHQRFFLYFYENCNVEVIESLHRKASSGLGRLHLHCHPEHLPHKSYHCSLRRRVLPA